MRRKTPSGSFVPTAYILKVPLLLQDQRVPLLISNNSVPTNPSLRVAVTVAAEATVVAIRAMVEAAVTAAKAADPPVVATAPLKADINKDSPAMALQGHKAADLPAAATAPRDHKAADPPVVAMVLRDHLKVVDALAAMVLQGQVAVVPVAASALRGPVVVLAADPVVAPECRKSCWSRKSS